MQLSSLPEPTPLKNQTRTLLAERPAIGRALLAQGDWIAEPLWLLWGNCLLDAGVEPEQFRRIVVGYENELRLWLVGERNWDHTLHGLIGRVGRRARPRSTSEREVATMQND